MLCKCQGLFRLTRDVQLTYTQSGSAIAKIGLACSEKFKDKETQLFLDAVVFGKPAELINQYAGSKGTQIFLTGKLQTDSWEKDGQKHYKTSMVVEDFQLVSNGSTAQPQQQPQQGYQQGGYQQPHTAYRQPQRQMPDRNALPEIDMSLDEIPF